MVGLALNAPVAALADYGVSTRAHDTALHAALVAGSDEELRILAQAVGRDAQLRYVDQVRYLELAHQRNDPATTFIDPATGVPYQWAFQGIGADRALNLSRGSPDILVGVVDSGIVAVPDLAGKVARSWYYTIQAGDATDTEGHGTFVSSIIAANNDDGFGIAGYCGACRLDVFKDLRLSEFSAAQAIRRLVDDGVRIINLSVGRFGGASFVMADALEYAIGHGVLVVAAAGNDGIGLVNFPAWWLQPANGVLGYGLAVGASDSNGNRAAFSNWGTRLSLVAPGAYSSDCRFGIYGALSPVFTDFAADCGNKLAGSGGAIYAYSSGTSFAVPEVAGVAALVWAARPELKNYEVASILEQSATRPPGSGWQPDRGWGVLNAARALEVATGRSSADYLVLRGLYFDARPRAGKRFTLFADVAWQDNAPVNRGTALCVATVGNRRVADVEGTLFSGRASCSWRVPPWAAGRMVARITATDLDGNGATRGVSLVVRR